MSLIITSQLPSISLILYDSGAEWPLLTGSQARVIFFPRRDFKSLETFMVVTTWMGKMKCYKLLNGQASGMLLNMWQPPTTKNYPAPNINSAEIEQAWYISPLFKAVVQSQHILHKLLLHWLQSAPGKAKPISQRNFRMIYTPFCSTVLWDLSLTK